MRTTKMVVGTVRNFRAEINRRKTSIFFGVVVGRNQQFSLAGYAGFGGPLNARETFEDHVTQIKVTWCVMPHVWRYRDRDVIGALRSSIHRESQEENILPKGNCSPTCLVDVPF